MSKLNKTIHKSFTVDFCRNLEYHLSRAFAESGDENLVSFWCDGVKLPFYDKELSMQNVLSTKKINTGAWRGLQGKNLMRW